MGSHCTRVKQEEEPVLVYLNNAPFYGRVGWDQAGTHMAGGWMNVELNKTPASIWMLSLICDDMIQRPN